MDKAFSKLVIALLIASVFAFSLGSGNVLAGTAPTPVQPSGTITDVTPQFQWLTVSGADHYQFQVVQGSSVVYTKTVGLEMCGPSTCGFSPTTSLSYTTYKWRVKAQASGVWGSFSAYTTFKVIKDATIPIPQKPWGAVSDTTPTFIWSKVTGATNYQFKLLLKDSTLVYAKTVSSSACGSTTCSSTPSTVLNDGGYQWQVRAKVGGVWKSYSSSNNFSLVTGFDSEFTSNATGWTPLNGTWKVSSGYYQTAGLADMTVSTAHDNEFSNFTYEVKMKRAGCVNCENAIYFFGSPGSIGREGDWDDGCRFAYTNDGMYSIVMYRGTLHYTLLDWTPYSGISGGWTTLKVAVHGAYARFFINGTEVASGNLPSFDVGEVGVAFFRDASSTSNRLYVDWAKLSVLPISSSVVSGEGIDISDLGVGSDLLSGDPHMSP